MCKLAHRTHIIHNSPKSWLQWQVQERHASFKLAGRCVIRHHSCSFSTEWTRVWAHKCVPPKTQLLCHRMKMPHSFHTLSPWIDSWLTQVAFEAIWPEQVQEEGFFFCVREAEVACESGSGERIPRDYGCGRYGSYTVSLERRLNPKKDVSMTANFKTLEVYLSEHWRQISLVSTDCMLAQRLCTYRRRKPISGSFSVFMHLWKLKKRGHLHFAHFWLCTI